ncbi:MAG: CDP-diacylglycerol--serine O-phosphatidyltransferase [Gemmatimonadales bacterium]
MELIPRRSSLRPPDMRRVVVVMPSAFTLGNLFFGFWSIVYAFNGNYRWAGWFIVFAAILDMLDGRVARLSGTNSRFGAELDSLVDVISFGVAPALLVYFLDFAAAGRFAWVLCYIYVVGTALRLARYNVLAASGAKSNPGWFTGMPSPAAGCTLAVFYPFSQTEWYRASLAYLDLQHQGLVVLLLLLSLLMVSNVKYPRFPPIGFRSQRGLFGLAVHVVILGGGLLWPEYFLFPLGLFYMAFGVVRAFFLSFLERNDSGAEPAAAPVANREIAEVDPPVTHERRRIWGDRRGEPME